tara:strand:+ start:796 stop:2685 length:1890 start_codon:yes stop_codon:yes gene_type:complete
MGGIVPLTAIAEPNPGSYRFVSQSFAGTVGIGASISFNDIGTSFWNPGDPIVVSSGDSTGIHPPPTNVLYGRISIVSGPPYSINVFITEIDGFDDLAPPFVGNYNNRGPVGPAGPSGASISSFNTFSISTLTVSTINGFQFPQSTPSPFTSTFTDITVQNIGTISSIVADIVDCAFVFGLDVNASQNFNAPLSYISCINVFDGVHTPATLTIGDTATLYDTYISTINGYDTVAVSTNIQNINTTLADYNDSFTTSNVNIIGTEYPTQSTIYYTTLMTNYNSINVPQGVVQYIVGDNNGFFDSSGFPLAFKYPQNPIYVEKYISTAELYVSSINGLSYQTLSQPLANKLGIVASTDFSLVSSLTSSAIGTEYIPDGSPPVSGGVNGGWRFTKAINSGTAKINWYSLNRPFGLSPPYTNTSPDRTILKRDLTSVWALITTTNPILTQGYLSFELLTYAYQAPPPGLSTFNSQWAYSFPSNALPTSVLAFGGGAETTVNPRLNRGYTYLIYAQDLVPKLLPNVAITSPNFVNSGGLYPSQSEIAYTLRDPYDIYPQYAHYGLGGVQYKEVASTPTVSYTDSSYGELSQIRITTSSTAPQTGTVAFDFTVQSIGFRGKNALGNTVNEEYNLLF